MPFTSLLVPSRAPVRPLGRAALAVALVLVSAGCGLTPPTSAPGAPPPAGTGARGVPGFDTRDYPGGDVMARWLEVSPYRWVGYYLPSPCYTGTTWAGRRGMLEAQGWGMAVVYVGEQDWAAMSAAPAEEEPKAVEASETAPRCTRDNLTADVGGEHGRAAAASMADEGFPVGSVVHLDVERVASVSPELLAYVGGWVDAVLADGRFAPGLYAHRTNAETLHGAVAARWAEAGRSGSPPLWVAGSGDFDLEAAPEESGVAAADVWQGAFDVRETWDGVTLRIDRNVASGPDPSAPDG